DHFPAGAIGMDREDVDVPLRAAEPDRAQEQSGAVGRKGRVEMGWVVIRKQAARGAWGVDIPDILPEMSAVGFLASECQALAVGRPARAPLVETVPGVASQWLKRWIRRDQGKCRDKCGKQRDIVETFHEPLRRLARTGCAGSVGRSRLEEIL